MGNYDKAIAAFETRRDADPKSLPPLIQISAPYAEASQMEEARATLMESLKRFPKHSTRRPRRVLRYKNPEEKERIVEYLCKEGLARVIKLA